MIVVWQLGEMFNVLALLCDNEKLKPTKSSCEVYLRPRSKGIMLLIKMNTPLSIIANAKYATDAIRAMSWFGRAYAPSCST